MSSRSDRLIGLLFVLATCAASPMHPANPHLSMGTDVAMHPASPDKATLVIEILDPTVAPAKPIACCAAVLFKQTYFVPNNEKGMLRITGLGAGKDTLRVVDLGWPVQPLDTVTLVKGKVSHVRHVMKGPGPGVVKY